MSSLNTLTRWCRNETISAQGSVRLPDRVHSAGQAVTHQVTGQEFQKNRKYKSLLASVREVGIIEPLNVYPQSGGKYLILDGHARKAALDELKVAEVRCLVATEDESYTPNRHVNRISPIQAIRMIVKALDAGLPPERIATSLNLAVQTVRSNRHALQGICPEAVEIIKDKEVSQDTLALLKKVKAVRQIEMVDLMCAAGTYTATYARALVMTTPKDQLVDPENPRKIPGVKPEDLARLEHEMRVQEKDFRLLDETYNEQVMALTIARGYLPSSARQHSCRPIPGAALPRIPDRVSEDRRGIRTRGLMTRAAT